MSRSPAAAAAATDADVVAQYSVRLLKGKNLQHLCNSMNYFCDFLLIILRKGQER